MKITIVAVVVLVFLAGLGGSLWWTVQSDWYDKGMMDE